MSNPNSPSFDVGDRIVVSGHFRTTANASVDPTAVYVTHYRTTDGTGATGASAYPDDAGVERMAQGIFNYAVTLTAAGEYWFRMASSGTVFAAMETAIHVRSSKF